MRSIYKTFLASGMKVKVLATDKNPDLCNLLFFASEGNIKPNADYLAENKIDVNNAVVLKDEFPVLDVLNAEAAKRWRRLSISSFYSDEEQRTLPVFN
jgi:hypothetical protein